MGLMDTIPKLKAMGIKNKETHKYHYKLAVERGTCPCGEGSRPDFVTKTGTIDFIHHIINKYQIESINDSPCGVFGNWTRLVNLTDVNYTGYDINDLIIERNKKEYPDIPFYELDIVNEVMPKADLIICRDCFFHLPLDFITKALANFKSSGAKYLLATEHKIVTKNVELTQAELDVEAGNRLINLQIEPFSIGTPLEVHIEETKKYTDVSQDREMCLWEL